MHTFWTYKLPRELESWFSQPTPMRSIASAKVRHHGLFRDVQYVTIQHQTLAGIDSDMIVWWLRYFCYQNVQLANGKTISAFTFWHPLCHRHFDLDRHSLSGETGLADGAQISLEVLHDDVKLCSGKVQVLAFNNSGFSLKYQHCPSGPAILDEAFYDTPAGVRYESRLISVNGDRIKINQQAITKWILYRIETIGNLQVFLPSIFKSQSAKNFEYRRAFS